MCRQIRSRSDRQSVRLCCIGLEMNHRGKGGDWLYLDQEGLVRHKVNHCDRRRVKVSDLELSEESYENGGVKRCRLTSRSGRFRWRIHYDNRGKGTTSRGKNLGGMGEET